MTVINVRPPWIGSLQYGAIVKIVILLILLSLLFQIHSLLEQVARLISGSMSVPMFTLVSFRGSLGAYGTYKIQFHDFLMMAPLKSIGSHLHLWHETKFQYKYPNIGYDVPGG